MQGIVKQGYILSTTIISVYSRQTSCNRAVVLCYGFALVFSILISVGHLASGWENTESAAQRHRTIDRLPVS